MSFSAFACYPSDKFHYGQCEELGVDFFDEFLTYSPIEEDRTDQPSLQPSISFEGSSNSEKNCISTSSSPLDFETKDAADHLNWRDDLSLQRSYEEDHLYSELTGRAAISDSELLSLEGITLDSPRIDTYSCPSLPSSPSPAGAVLSRKKTRIAKCLSKKVKRVAKDIEKRLRSPTRKCESTTKLNISELWGEKLDTPRIDLDFDHSILPLSPPPSSKVPQLSGRFVGTKEKFIRNGEPGFNHGLNTHIPPSSAYDTPLSTPIVGSEDSRRVNSQRHVSDLAPFPSTPKMEHGSNRWGQLPNAIKYERGLMHGSLNCDPPLLWNHASTAPMAQPLPTALHTNPQRATQSLAMQLQNNVSYRANERAYMPTTMRSGGLMIQIPESPPQRQFVVQSSPKQHGHFPAHPYQYTARPRHMQSQPKHQQPSRTPRKKISHSSDSESHSSRSSPAYRVKKRKAPRSNKHSTPPAPALGGSIDFVNYTPNDSKKLLTGVAPSGSSKTKARREKEAMDKRRRLSQAALRAVREAGGDIESLVEQGLLV